MSSEKNFQDDGTTEGDDIEEGAKCELRVWQKRYKHEGGEEKVMVESWGQNQNFDKAYALVVDQQFTPDNRLDYSRLTINSPHILQAFRDVIKSYPTVASDFSEPFDMRSPFQMLYHYWKDLDEWTKALDDDEARLHMNLLLDYMEVELGPDRNRIETEIKKGQINYLQAWSLYRPGELLLSFENGHPWLLKAAKTAYEENTKVGPWLEVHCTYTDYDGVTQGEANRVIKMYQKRNFASHHPANILDLPVFPRKFYLSQDESLETSLKSRGEKFLSLRGALTLKYDGLAEYMKEPPPDFYDPDMSTWDTVWLPFTESGRVIVDRKTFQEENHLAQGGIAPLEAPDPALCPPFAHGFSLSRKEWSRFYVTQLQQVDWKENSFDSLVMKESQKTVLKALVASHNYPDNPRDQMQQKSKGLVVLLHGSPGSGKTLTAECSAEVTKRPLFTASIAELNKHDRAWYFEWQLSKVLQYATIWKAVILLDEADVFLEARTDEGQDAVARNALVAVFLRHLEYFSGIVFLTTNRIHVFDPAMKSRIHIALGYHPPGKSMRRSMWMNSLKALPVDEVDISFNDSNEIIENIVQENLNGREITNTINTARTLARYEKKPLRLSHIKTVLGIRNEFDQTLKKMAVAATDPKRANSVGPVRQGSLLASLSLVDDEPDQL